MKEGRSYSPLMLTPSTYLYRPKIDENVKRLHYTGVDLLRIGTKGTVGVGENVVKVFPFNYKECRDVKHDAGCNAGNVNSLIAKSQVSSAVVSQDNGERETHGENVGRNFMQVRFGKGISRKALSSSETEDEITSVSRQGHSEKRRKAAQNDRIFDTVSFSTVTSSRELTGQNNSLTSGNRKRKGDSRRDKHLDISRQDVLVQQHSQQEKKRRKSLKSVKTVEDVDKCENAGLPEITDFKERYCSKNLQGPCFEGNVTNNLLCGGIRLEGDVGEAAATSESKTCLMVDDHPLESNLIENDEKLTENHIDPSFRKDSSEACSRISDSVPSKSSKSSATAEEVTDTVTVSPVAIERNTPVSGDYDCYQEDVSDSLFIVVRGREKK